jgi:hypothetical protein
VAWVLRAAGTHELPAGSTVMVTLSGRGDKDMPQLMGDQPTGDQLMEDQPMGGYS